MGKKDKTTVYCDIPNCRRKALKTSIFCGPHERAGKEIKKVIPQKKKVDFIYIYSNGTFTCRDSVGEIIEGIGYNWMELFFNYLESQGVNVLEIKTIETIVNGRTVYVKPTKTERGWGWSFYDF